MRLGWLCARGLPAVRRVAPSLRSAASFELVRDVLQFLRGGVERLHGDIKRRACHSFALLYGNFREFVDGFMDAVVSSVDIRPLQSASFGLFMIWRQSTFDFEGQNVGEKSVFFGCRELLKLLPDLLQLRVVVPGGLGNPSSVMLPFKLAVAGSVMLCGTPALTLGG